MSDQAVERAKICERLSGPDRRLWTLSRRSLPGGAFGSRIHGHARDGMAEETIYTCGGCGEQMEWVQGPQRWECPSCGRLVRPPGSRWRPRLSRRIAIVLGALLATVLLVIVLAMLLRSA